LKPPIWSKSRTTVRLATETELSFTKRVGIIAESLRQDALDVNGGKHPKIVIHFSESWTDAVIVCTVVW
jgi:hypothetical protein